MVIKPLLFLSAWQNISAQNRFLCAMIKWFIITELKINTSITLTYWGAFNTCCTVKWLPILSHLFCYFSWELGKIQFTTWSLKAKNVIILTAAKGDYGYKQITYHCKTNSSESKLHIIVDLNYSLHSESKNGDIQFI